MKLLFIFAVVFIAFAKPSEGTQLSCYHCKSAEYPSNYTDFNKDILVCGEDQNKWPIKNENDQLSFHKCKKFVEKVKINNKDDVLVIRTMGPNKMDLNPELFTEYTCDTNLCNSAVTICATAFAVLFSIAATLASNL